MEGGIRKIKALWRGGESLENKGWLLCPCDRASSRPPFASNTAFAHGVHCSNREQSRVPASPRGTETIPYLSSPLLMFYLSQRNREGHEQELMTVLTDAQDRNSSLLGGLSQKEKVNWSHCAVWNVGCTTLHGRWLCVVSLAPSVFWLLTVKTMSNYYSQEKDEQT